MFRAAEHALSGGSTDDFASHLLEVQTGAEPSNDRTDLTELAQRYSYVFPDAGSLRILAGLGPLVEMGAGTGYWASRLRDLGVDVLAFDQAPLGGSRQNRYHEGVAAWSEVLAGDHTELAAHGDRALFLCWPPLYSSLGECLAFYTGETVACIGDGGFRTALVSGLTTGFRRAAVHPAYPLEPDPTAPATLSVWHRSNSRRAAGVVNFDAREVRLP